MDSTLTDALRQIMDRLEKLESSNSGRVQRKAGDWFRVVFDKTGRELQWVVRVIATKGERRIARFKDEETANKFVRELELYIVELTEELGGKLSASANK